MALVLDKENSIYRPFSFEDERQFENKVIELADQIFGPASIYVNVKKRIKGADIVSIPDGYVVDMTQPAAPQLFVVENEIVSHDPFKHIGIQMLKFVTGFEEAQLAIRQFLMTEISKEPEKLARLEEGSRVSKSRNIDAYLDRAVFGDFSGLVVVDERRPELNRVLEKINANISVLELKTFRSDAVISFTNLIPSTRKTRPRFKLRAVRRTREQCFEVSHGKISSRDVQHLTR
jgi:hypothetical protein